MKQDSSKKLLYGEVSTPVFLVQQMLNLLPDTVWSNPNLKWLDPCCGTGVFVLEIMKRLMCGLVNIIPDEVSRYMYIMGNMIYTCELQQEIFIEYSKVVDPDGNIYTNAYLGSYLDEDFERWLLYLKVKKFDIIVMNPPYNDSSGKRGSGNVLWTKFVSKAINDNLHTNGYLLAVHPSGWRDVMGHFKPIQKLLLSKDIKFLEMHNQKDGLKTFGAETRYDFYLLRNCTNSTNSKTIINCQDGSSIEVHLNTLAFIPNGNFRLYSKLLASDGEAKVRILRDSTYHSQNACVSRTMHDNFIYPVVNYIGKDNVMRLFYTNDNTKGHFGIFKVILTTGKLKYVGSLLDADGDYGLTEFAFAIVDDIDKLYLIKKCVDSQAFRLFMMNCAVTDSYFNKKVLSTFKKDFYLEFL